MTALVGVLMGSQSDMPAMEKAAKELDARGIAHEVNVMSAHRDPEKVAEYAKSARERGIKVLICGAGLSAALPGVVAAHSDLPVIGVPLTSSTSVAGGLDALLSIAQMPPGVPVACVGVDNARNAAVLAARILSLMLFMVIERFRDAPEVYRRFRSGGRRMPEGLRLVDSWVRADLSGAYQVMECADAGLLQEWVAEWNEVTDFELIPITTSDQTRELMT